MRVAHMVLDLQFGSTGKGLLCGYLANRYNYDTVVSAWGPNAGHTFIDDRGAVYIHTMLPIGAIQPGVVNVLLGPGSVLDLDALHNEVRSVVSLSDAHSVPRFNLIIHPMAMVVRQRHKEWEKELVRIGSTMKGTGAALIEKIMRDPRVSPLIRDAHRGADAPIVDEFIDRCGRVGIPVIIDERVYNMAVDNSNQMLIEGAQGYSLGINRSFWPNATSREITPAQVLSDCALPLPTHYGLTVYGTLRTYPIRVANRYDASGVQIGHSGECYPDQFEMSWENLGVEPELTTVTKLKRRVFSFSYEQLEESLRLCRPHQLFLNFVNYTDEEAANSLISRINDIGYRYGCGGVLFLGHGPRLADVEAL